MSPKPIRARTSRGQRTAGKRLPADLVVFAVEGETEQRYLRALATRYRRRLTFKFVGKHSSLANHLDALRHDERNNSKASGYWIICDTDENAVHKAALERWLSADSHHVALTHPCFEYWLYLHFDSPVNFTDAVNAERALRKAWPEFKKGAPIPEHVISKVDLACERESKHQTAAPGRDFWQGDVGSDMPLLIEWLNERAKNHEEREAAL